MRADHRQRIAALLLGASLAAPLLLLAALSAARGWEFPALRPRGWSLDAWRDTLTGGAALGRSLLLSATAVSSANALMIIIVNTAAHDPGRADLRLLLMFLLALALYVSGLRFTHRRASALVEAALHDVRVDWQAPVSGHWQSALVVDNVRDLVLDDVSAGPAPNGNAAPAVVLTHVDGARVQHCRAQASTAQFLEVADTVRDVTLHANQF